MRTESSKEFPKSSVVPKKRSRDKSLKKKDAKLKKLDFKSWKKKGSRNLKKEKRFLPKRKQAPKKSPLRLSLKTKPSDSKVQKIIGFIGRQARSLASMGLKQRSESSHLMKVKQMKVGLMTNLHQ